MAHGFLHGCAAAEGAGLGASGGPIAGPQVRQGQADCTHIVQLWQHLQGAELREAAGCQGLACALHLLYARREGAEAPTCEEETRSEGSRLQNPRAHPGPSQLLAHPG